MRRTGISMTTELLDNLRRLSQQKGAPVAVLIRIAVPEYIACNLKK